MTYVAMGLIDYEKGKEMWKQEGLFQGKSSVRKDRGHIVVIASWRGLEEGETTLAGLPEEMKETQIGRNRRK